MKTSPECERARVVWMASLDDAAARPDAASAAHLSTCDACERWQQDMTSVNDRLRTLEYPRARVDLWNAVRLQIQPDVRSHAVERIRLIGAAVVGWRALELFVDLPLPWLHPIVPIVTVALVIWRMGGDVLAIQTAAPELQNRGV